MIRIREFLDELSGDVLNALCDKRGLPTARALEDRRSKLARSYRGDIGAFVADLRRPDLIAMLSGVFMHGPLAYQLPGANGMHKEQLKRIAASLFSDADEMPPEMMRRPELDERVEVERGPGHLDAVLRMLPRSILAAIAESLRVASHGSAHNIADRIARTETRDLVDFIAETFNRGFWNDVVEALGGARRKAFEDIATELRILTSDEPADGAAPAVEAAADPVPEKRGDAVNAWPSAALQPAGPRVPKTRAVLIHDPDLLVATFERLTAWAETMAFIAPTLDTDRGRNRLWDAVRRHSGKLEPSFVGVATASGDPIAMRTLYKLGKLRLLPALDAAMQCHVWRFERGNEVAALLLSGPFGAASLVAPLLSATLLEGARDTDFAMSMVALFEQARAAAYVPEPDFEAAYASTLSDLRPSLDRMHQVVTATFLRPAASTVEGSTLVRGVGGGPSPREAVSLLQLVFTDHATRVEDQAFAGADRRFTVLWLPALSLWARFQDVPGGIACTFGTAAPVDGSPLEPVFRVECAYDEDETASLSIREDEAGRSFFVIDADTDQAQVLAPVVGRTILRHLAAYVHDLARKSAYASNANGDMT